MTCRRALRNLTLVLTVLATVSAACSGSSGGNDGPTPVPTDVPTPTQQATVPTAISSQSSVPVRIRIPQIEVDANVIVLGVDQNRVMETPDNADDVAWYDFSARPGDGSNAIFSGHLDYIGQGPAVFWDLHRLRPGDLIEVDSENGSTFSYVVVWSKEYLANPTQAELDEIVGRTPVESITLMTTAGAYDGTQYTHRLVVRAEVVSAP